MRLLWLLPLVPYPPDTGGKMDTFFMLREFHRMGHRMEAGIVYHSRTPPEVPHEVAGFFQDIFFLPGNRKPLTAALLASVGDEVPFKFRKYYSPEAVKILADTLERKEGFDAIVVDHFHLAPLVLDTRAALSRNRTAVPPLVMRSHNVESAIVTRLAGKAENPLIQALAARESRKMRKYEAKVLGDFDLVAAISPVDQAAFLSMSRKPAKVISVTAGMDTETLKPVNTPPVEGEVVYVGSFDWQPNVDGALWLIEKVWPLITQKFPKAHLTLVGRKPPPYLSAKSSPSISLTGWVDSVAEYVSRASCCVVPLWIGSGMRYKILEAFALAKPVVSTTIGAEGIECRDGVEIVIRDDPEEFAEAVVMFLSNPEIGREFGSRGRKLVEERYSWQKVAGGFAKEIEALL